MIGYVIPTWNGAVLGEMLNTLPEGAYYRVIRTKELRLSVSQAWNMGIRDYLERGFETVIVCNDDILLRPDTGEQLDYALHVGQNIDKIKPEALMVTAYNTRDLPDLGFRWGIEPDFSCFAIGRKYWKEVGPFDEKFEGAYFEDNDSHRRVQLAGYQALSWAPIYHYGSITIKSDPVRKFEIQNAGMYEKNRSYYIEKWGGDTGSETFSTPFGR